MFQFTYYANEGTVAETALYRHYDTRGRLLYIGISLAPLARTRQHGLTAPWMRDVVRIEIEWFDSRLRAEQAERHAIRREKPAHNQTHRKRDEVRITVLDGAGNTLN